MVRSNGVVESISTNFNNVVSNRVVGSSASVKSMEVEVDKNTKLAITI